MSTNRAMDFCTEVRIALRRFDAGGFGFEECVSHVALAVACARQAHTAAAAPSAQSSAPAPDVNSLAQFIRSTNGWHAMGAGALAERICEWLESTAAAAPAPQQAAPAAAMQLVKVLTVIRDTLPHIGGNSMSVHSLLKDINSALSSSPAPAAQVELADERVNALIDEWAEAGGYAWLAGATDSGVSQADLAQLVHAAAALATQQQPEVRNGDPINNGGPAFPCMPPLTSDGSSAIGYPYPDEGMSIRDQFAGQAMQSSFGETVFVLEEAAAYERLAAHAYRMADAMLKAREVRHG